MNTAWTAASEEMYKATQDTAGAQPGDAGPQDGAANGNGSGPSNAGGENVTDAEFEEVK